MHGVDATALDLTLAPQDAIVFNHPHLGLADLQEQAAHARRHNVLIAHFQLLAHCVARYILFLATAALLCHKMSARRLWWGLVVWAGSGN